MSASNNTVRAITSILTTIVLSLALPSLAVAQEDSFAEANAKDTSDKTGTNPVNFQRDLRFYNEYAWLNTAGDGSQNVLTMEYRQPVFGDKWQFRARVPYVAPLTADFNNDGIDDIDESGLGDANFRLLKQPWFRGRHAIAIAMEFFLNTASEDALGSGTTTLGPQVFYAYFFGKNPLPIPGYRGGGLFAPGLQYRFSIDEDDGRSDTDAIAVDINYLALSEDKTRWLFVNPQILSDRESSQDYAFFDIEFGWMVKSRPGHSWYIRPTFTIGVDRPTDYGIEIGYKLVGW